MIIAGAGTIRLIRLTCRHNGVVSGESDEPGS